MDHQTRYQLALDLCARMTAKYPVIIGGVYGSTARGEDAEWSDLEMWFVVEDSCEAKGQHLIFTSNTEHPERSSKLQDTQSSSYPAQSKDVGTSEEPDLTRTLRLRKASAQRATTLTEAIAIGYRVYRQSELLEILTNPDARWPFHAGVLDQLLVLHGNPAQVREWMNRALATPRERFHAYLTANLPEFVIESYGRVHSSAARGDWATARYALTEVLFEMQTALCLLNRRWVTRDYDAGLLQVATFPKIPAGYGELVPALLEAQYFEMLLPLADKLVEAFWQLLESEGIVVRNFQSIEEIPI